MRYQLDEDKGDIRYEVEDERLILKVKPEVVESAGKSDIYVIATNDNATPTDRNVFSALRSLAEFINKKKNDIVQGVITFMNGLRIGKFVSGMIGGTGAAMWLDENRKSILEIDKIHAREELIVPKITFFW